MVLKNGQIPNMLSVLRIPLAVICTYLALNNDLRSLFVSLLIFLFAGFTDFVDGYLARKWKAISNFGKIIDPIADKVLNLGVLIAFSINDHIPWWVTGIICFREFILTTIRLALLPKNIIIQAINSGKLKTFSQFVFIVFLYLVLLGNFLNIISIEDTLIQLLINILMIWVVVITVYSGLEFFLKNYKNITKAFL